MRGHVSTESPWIYFYKPGYKVIHRVGGNTYYSDGEDPIKSRVSDSTKIELSPLQDTEESHLNNIVRINSVLRKLVSYPEGCQWKNIPNMWNLMVIEQQFFYEKGYKWPNTALNFLLRNKNNQSFVKKGGRDCPYPSEIINVRDN